VREGPAGAGTPLQGLTADETAFFKDGLTRFEGCAYCHTPSLTTGKAPAAPRHYPVSRCPTKRCTCFPTFSSITWARTLQTASRKVVQVQMSFAPRRSGTLGNASSSYTTGEQPTSSRQSRTTGALERGKPDHRDLQSVERGTTARHPQLPARALAGAGVCRHQATRSKSMVQLSQSVHGDLVEANTRPQ
jgi:hypothetical protein